MRTQRRCLRAIPWTSALLVAGLVVSGFCKAAGDAELERLLRDVCDKQVVLLGEDANHGSGATVALKTRLVERLVGRCGFRRIAFESGFYDFVEFGRAADRGEATQAQLADAIGGLWSTTSELQPLLPFLLTRANQRTIAVVGLDPQSGGATYRYAQQRMPDELAAYLDDARKASCRDEIDRLTNWRYDDTTSFYDDATRARIRSCASEIGRAAKRRKNDPNAAAVVAMARNLTASVDLEGPDAAARRDKAMYENLAWYLAKDDTRIKTVVWCATVHAAKASPFSLPDRKPMGAYVHDVFGDRSAAIGFSAISGGYGRPGQSQNALTTALDDSLEASSFKGFKGDFRYLDRKALDDAGEVRARALDYARSDSANWSRYVDGIVVMRNETPLHVMK
ncbi:MAG TPA: erythromycin esterase family protein [Rhodanobacteraceae bacterium]|nr:erythromycin esterase family protein [Rhodanobacteraceae bacterium]